MEDFTDKQNEVFKRLFGALKNKGASFTTQAHTLIEFDDDNFIRLFNDTNNTIVGSDDEIKLVNDRAKYLGLRNA